jgi:hypothetical protein
VQLEELGELKKSSEVNGNRTRGLPAFSTVPEPTRTVYLHLAGAFDTGKYK